MKTQRNRKQKPATDAKPAETDAAKIEAQSREGQYIPPPETDAPTFAERLDQRRERLGEIHADTLLTHRGNSFLPDDLDGVDTDKPDAVARYAQQWASVFCVLERRARDLIAKAIREGDESEITEPGDRFVNDTLTDVLFVTENSPATRAIIAAAFKVTPEELQAATARRMAKIKAAATSDNAEQGELFPAAEPTTEEIRDRAAAELETLARAEYGIVARPTSKLDRKIPYFLPSNNIALSLRGAGDLTIDWRPPQRNGAALRVTPYDQEVETAISNLIERNGAGVVTPWQIFHTMNGTPPRSRVSDTALAAICDSIMKLKDTVIEIKKIDKKGRGELVRGNVLDLIEHQTISGGKVKSRRFGFFRPGLFYQAERQLKGLQSTDPKHLNISAGYWRRGAIEQGKGEITATPPNGRGWEKVKISITELSITVRKYLLGEIHRIKATPSMEARANKILYDSIAEYANTSDEAREAGQTGSATETAEQAKKRRAAEKQRTRRLRMLVLAILGHFQATGLITRFRETTAGRRVDGIVIEADKTDPTLKKIEATAKRRAIQRRDAKG